MKREHIVSTAITDEEHKKLSKIIANRMLSGDKASVSIILREALSQYLANGNSPPVQDNEQEPTEKPATNPFADLSFD